MVGGVSLLFMLSVGYMDRLHQSPALECASGGGRAGKRGVNGGAPGADGGWGEGQEGGKRLKWIRGVSIETGEKGQTPGVRCTEKQAFSPHTHKLSTPRGRRHLRVTRNYSDSP